MSGNRYILKSAEAYNDKLNQEIVNMKSVNAFFILKMKIFYMWTQIVENIIIKL